MRVRWWIAAAVVLVVIAVPVLGSLLYAHAKYEYDHPYGEVDGVLWRQVAQSLDPLKSTAYSQDRRDPAVQRTPDEYVDALRAQRWDGSEGTASAVRLGEGSAVIYDISMSSTVVSFSAFVSSGPRPDVPTDRGNPYSGPSTIYTCLTIVTPFGADTPPHNYLPYNPACPRLLIDQLAPDAQYADPRLFQG